MSQVARVLCLSALLLFATAVVTRKAAAWVVTPELGYGWGVAAMPNGDILSAGQSNGADLYDFSVRRQRGLDGTDVWHYMLDGSAPDIPGSNNDSAYGLALDAAGDVIAAGTTRNTGTGLDLQIVKLGATDGAPIWTKTLDSVSSKNDGYGGLAVHSGGDVVVAGVFDTAPPQFSVVRLAGATGAPLWQHDNPTARAASIVFDPAGNVIASGVTYTTPGQQDAFVAKLDGATGSEVWRAVVDGDLANDDDYASTLAIDASGDVYMGGRVVANGGDGFAVQKLSGATGAVMWRYDHPAAPNTSVYGIVWSLLLDGSGNLYAAGEAGLLVKISAASGLPLWERLWHQWSFATVTSLPDGALVVGGKYRYGFAIQKVAPADGRKRWRRKIRGNTYNHHYANAVTTDAAGEVVAVGNSVNPLPRKVNGEHSFTVMKACGANGRVRDTTTCP